MTQPSINEAMQVALQHHQAGRLNEAEATYRRILALEPDHLDALNNLGIALGSLGRHQEAVELFRRALALQPNLADVHNNLGNTLKNMGQLDQAIASYHQALRIQPELAEIHDNLGTALRAAGMLEQAAVCHQTAIRLRPDFAMPYSNLGNACKDMGQLDEALACYRHALRLAPDFLLAHNSLINTIQFHPGFDEQMIRAERLAWNRQHAEGLKKLIRPHGNDRDPDRRLRIGYVSPDFRFHAESFFVVPLLEHHNHQQFEIHGYSSVARPDAVTQRVKRSADAWHEVYGLSDQELAEKIRADRIDILMDLTMHMGNSRLLAFARKPAPVQISWLAYPGSTGLATIDYRLSDRFLDPPELDQPQHFETPLRLPDCWICYDPLTDVAPANHRRERAGRPVCFGSLNNPCKMNEPLLRIWAQVLEAVPESRLCMLVLADGHRQRIIQLFGSMGISPGRLEFVGPCARPVYLQLYERFDICLDTLPYNGITTTCDALWMGVPVITLSGNTRAGRAGHGILSTLELPELVAQTPAQFVEKATELAGDLPRLDRLKSTLRARMRESALMNSPRFAGHVESAYRKAWQSWCAEPARSSQ